MSHKDQLAALNSSSSLKEKIRVIHEHVKGHFDFIQRLAVAIYDGDSDTLSTLSYSADAKSSLEHYSVHLSEVPSLKELAEFKRPRVINDLAIFDDHNTPHANAIREGGYLASYTFPMFVDDELLGFIFFNADQTHVFTEPVLVELDTFAHMLGLIVHSEQHTAKTLIATVKSAQDITHSRDPETGDHLQRMSRYARLIAEELADTHGFNDDYINHVFLFSPLHDIGKISIPDDILLKPGKLDEDEFKIMKTHAHEGRKIIDELLNNYGLDGLNNLDMLRNIVEHHHEAVDGSGYPAGLKNNDIPLEARIVTVADVFDALTSHRPYKPAWNNSVAFAKLQELADHKLDRECVEALIKRKDDAEVIQRQFQENRIG